MRAGSKSKIDQARLAESLLGSPQWKTLAEPYLNERLERLRAIEDFGPEDSLEANKKAVKELKGFIEYLKGKIQEGYEAANTLDELEK